MDKLLYADIAARYPSQACHLLRDTISATLLQKRIKIIVLDDDPTGIQTVHGCLLLTNWQPENLAMAFRDKAPFFYILTNTRSMTAAESVRITREVMQAVLEVNKQAGYHLIVVSRSDSTLRGHFPQEPDTIRQVLEANDVPVMQPTFFIPAFLEAERYTIGQVHYMKEGNDLIPVGDTEFAKDNVFGYTSSKLSDYIIEKTKGIVQAEDIGWLSLAMIRNNDPGELAEAIRSMKGNSYITVDALDYDDLRTFSVALLNVLTTLYSSAILRTSSSLPKALSGIPESDLLNHERLDIKPGTGLFMVGSHVQKSTLQLQHLLTSEKVQGVEIDINNVLGKPILLMKEVLETLKQVNQKGLTPVVYTSRQELRLDDVAKRLEIGRTISDFLVQIVRNLPFVPSYLVAKGGITSHDILTRGLLLETAMVTGQLLPGVPVIKTSGNHYYPNMPFIIFPGNVGDKQALLTAFNILN